MSVFLLFPRLYVRVFTVPQVVCEGFYCSPGYMSGFLLFPRLYVRVFTHITFGTVKTLTYNLGNSKNPDI
jgi:hypothetical protein